MKDRYLDFVNSPFGASVARSIGLPQPEVLRRHALGRAEFGGITAIGAGPSPTLFEPLIILVMGLLIGTLILSLMLAITSINDIAG